MTVHVRIVYHFFGELDTDFFPINDGRRARKVMEYNYGSLCRIPMGTPLGVEKAFAVPPCAHLLPAASRLPSRAVSPPAYNVPASPGRSAGRSILAGTGWDAARRSLLLAESSPPVRCRCCPGDVKCYVRTRQTLFWQRPCLSCDARDDARGLETLIL